LGSQSQYQFGHCALSLHPAHEQPVATATSGYIYDGLAILEYLLTKTQELKKKQKEYEQHQQAQDAAEQQEEERKRKAKVETFENSQKVVIAKKQKREANPLQRTSYWLAESQPRAVNMPVRTSVDGTATTGTTALVVRASTTRAPPPKRPPSPNSQQPLRRKDLIPLDLKRNSDHQVICAISKKTISIQQSLALVTDKDSDKATTAKHPAQVVLESVYHDLGAEKVCPVTGRKIVKILRLQKGGSSFASADGVVEAKQYRPTIT
jgi:hypothetical protein